MRFGFFEPYDWLQMHRRSLLSKPGRAGLDGRRTRVRDFCFARLELGCASVYRKKDRVVQVICGAAFSSPLG
jgi:hypothetical protein